ncbi:MAG TPA: UvrB/UvrC motif-containing protein, partial [Flavobacterium sp.]|nr:UvrB/UvrC motif-containing protein [Flavobacterium sp.]
EKNGLKPKALNKKIENTLADQFKSYNQEEPGLKMAAEPTWVYHNAKDLDKQIKDKRKEMETAAKNLDFMQAAKLRDEIKELNDKKSKL